MHPHLSEDALKVDLVEPNYRLSFVPPKECRVGRVYEPTGVTKQTAKSTQVDIIGIPV